MELDTKWTYDILLIDGVAHKAILYEKSGDIIDIVDELDDETIKNIVEIHNRNLFNELKRGMIEGIELMKNVACIEVSKIIK